MTALELQELKFEIQEIKAKAENADKSQKALEALDKINNKEELNLVSEQPSELDKLLLFKKNEILKSSSDWIKTYMDQLHPSVFAIHLNKLQELEKDYNTLAQSFDSDKKYQSEQEFPRSELLFAAEEDVETINETYKGIKENHPQLKDKELADTYLKERSDVLLRMLISWHQSYDVLVKANIEIKDYKVLEEAEKWVKEKRPKLSAKSLQDILSDLLPRSKEILKSLNEKFELYEAELLKYIESEEISKGKKELVKALWVLEGESNSWQQKYGEVSSPELDQLGKQFNALQEKIKNEKEELEDVFTMKDLYGEIKPIKESLVPHFQLFKNSDLDLSKDTHKKAIEFFANTLDKVDRLTRQVLQEPEVLKALILKEENDIVESVNPFLEEALKALNESDISLSGPVPESVKGIEMGIPNLFHKRFLSSYVSLGRLQLRYKFASAEKLEKRRTLLFEIRGKAAHLLKLYKTAKTKKSTDKREKKEVKTFLEKVNEALVNIGRYQIENDTYLDVKNAYRDFQVKQGPFLAINSIKDETNEHWVELKKSINTLDEEIVKWLTAHKKAGGFENQKKEIEIAKIFVELKEFNDKHSLGIDLKRTAQKSDYVKSDSAFKKIESLYLKIVRLEKGYSQKTLRKIGDFDSYSAKWLITAENYKSIKLLDDRKKLLESNGEWKNNVNTIFKVSSEWESLKENYNELKKLWKKNPPKIEEDTMDEAREIRAKINVWLAGYKLVEDAVKETAFAVGFAKDFLSKKGEVESQLKSYDDFLEIKTGYGFEDQNTFGLLTRIKEMYDAKGYLYDDSIDASKLLMKRDILDQLERDIFSLVPLRNTLIEDPDRNDFDKIKSEIIEERKEYDKKDNKILEAYNAIKEKIELINKDSISLNDYQLKDSVLRLMDFWLNNYGQAGAGKTEEQVDIELWKLMLETIANRNALFANLEGLNQVLSLVNEIRDVHNSETEAIEFREQRRKHDLKKLVKDKALPVVGEIEADEKLLEEIAKEDKKVEAIEKVFVDKLNLTKIDEIGEVKLNIELNEGLAKLINDNLEKLSSILFNFKAYLSDVQRQLNKDNIKQEQEVFAVFGPYDYDYAKSGYFGEKEIALMNRAMENAIGRFRRMMKGGALFKDAYEMVEHIPAAMLADSFILELKMWQDVESAFLKEEAEKTRDAFNRTDLNLILSDEKSAMSQLYTLKEKIWFKKEASDKVKVRVFTSEQMTKAEAEFNTIFNNALGSLTVAEDVSNLDELFKKDADAKRNAKISLIGMKLVGDALSTVAGNIDDEQIKQISQSIGGVLKVVGGLAAFIQDKPDPAKSTQAYFDQNLKTVTGHCQTLLALGVTASKTANIMHEIPLIATRVVPGLILVADVLTLGVNVYGIAKMLSLRSKTSALAKKAEVIAPEYLGPLNQELHSLSNRIVQNVVDTGATAVSAGATIASFSGVGAAITAPIAFTAGAVKLGNKIVFAGINEAELSEARKLRDKARKGDREAKMKLFEKSPRYAKMFIAIGASKDKPDEIAVEFLLQRGFTERDLSNEKMSAMVIRKALLEVSSERDDDESRISNFKETFKKIGVWLKLDEKSFWSNGKFDIDYPQLRNKYSLTKLNSIVEYGNSVAGKGKYFSLEYIDRQVKADDKRKFKEDLKKLKIKIDSYLEVLDEKYLDYRVKKEEYEKKFIASPTKKGQDTVDLYANAVKILLEEKTEITSVLNKMTVLN